MSILDAKLPPSVIEVPNLVVNHKGSASAKPFTPSAVDHNPTISSYSSTEPSTRYTAKPTIRVKSTPRSYINLNNFERQAPSLANIVKFDAVEVLPLEKPEDSGNELKIIIPGNSDEGSRLGVGSKVEFKHDQPYYTTVSPDVFFSTISHPRVTTVRPSFKNNIFPKSELEFSSKNYPSAPSELPEIVELSPDSSVSSENIQFPIIAKEDNAIK